MAPGPRKKNFNRRNDNSSQDVKKGLKTGSETEEKDSKNNLNDPIVVADPNAYEDKRYTKRTVTSNWNKYDEIAVDPHADTMRGKDFEVLLSYSGGSQSQMQLQDEKEWDEVNVTEKSIVLDFVDLRHVIKCIPFHKRMNIPKDIFDEAQLAKFTSNAENYKASYSVLENEPASPVEQKVSKKMENIDPSLNIIESYESEVVNDTAKPFVLEEKTESIIESLASCLSLKSLAPEKVNANIKIENTTTDDLDFLLSLSSPPANKAENPEETLSVQKQTNVDDWLNSILDD